MPTVSVILPFYNAASSLDKAIESIVSQEGVGFELILCDNNSTDGSSEIARRWEQQHSVVFLCKEERQGVVFASNKAASLASGKYIARMDADDVALPGKLRNQADYLSKQPGVDVVAGKALYKSQMSDTEGFRRYVDWSNSILSYKSILKRRFIESPLINPTVMWRRETGEKLGLYVKGDFPEDYELWLRWLEAGVRIEKLDDFVLEWHDSPGRLTRCHSEYSDRSFYRIKTEYLSKWLARENPFHPHVGIWGASRISRQRTALLESAGIQIDCYIDIRHDRQLDKPILHYSELPEPGSLFILVYQGQQEIRQEIVGFLEGKAYVEGRDFLLLS